MKSVLYTCGRTGLSEHTIGVGYLLANVPGLTVAKTRAELHDADWIGVSSMAAGLREACEIATEHGNRVPVVLGGQGALWDGWRKYPFAAVCIGDGETPARFALGCYEIPGDDLDRLNPPDIGRCDHGGIPLVTSRGCPFNCAFCSSAQFWGRKARFHSAGYVVDYVKALAVKHPSCGLLWIMDDLATANKARWPKIARLWADSGLAKRFRLRLNMRADLFTEEMAVILRAMNTEHVSIGIESGSDKVLAVMGKQTTAADNQRAVDVGHRLGVPVRGFIIHGFPGETEEDWRETEGFLARNRDKMLPPAIFQYTPFPGCAAYAGENPLELSMETA